MSDSKTTCSDCGAAILQITADMYYGRCVPCHRKVAVITPDDFELPGEILARVEEQDEDPEVYRKLTWLFGTRRTRGLLDWRKEQAKLYRQWAPRLRAFAAKCRKTNRPPPDRSLSIRDHEKQRICELTCQQSIVGLPNTVTICSMPLIALPVAQRLWPSDDGIVLLTPEEESQWNELYSPDTGDWGWLRSWWWIIDDSPQREATFENSGETITITRWREGDVPDGESPWLVHVGECAGPLSGSGHMEWWSWDGKRAKFVSQLGRWIS
jgi:hypothetical protein